jgi:hypothetical protein
LDFSGNAFAKSAISGSGLLENGFGNSAKVEGLFAQGSPLNELTAETTFTETLTSTGGLYNFTLTGPILEVNANGNLNQRPMASYFFDLLVNDVSILTSFATLSGDLNNNDLVKGGNLDLGGQVSAVGFGFRAEFDDFAGAIDLGIPAGETFEFQQILRVDVSTFGFEAGGAASFGDPGSIDGTFGRLEPAQNVIPEPASLAAWTGLALVGGVVCWRRRRKK